MGSSTKAHSQELHQNLHRSLQDALCLLLHSPRLFRRHFFPRLKLWYYNLVINLRHFRMNLFRIVNYCIYACVIIVNWKTHRINERLTEVKLLLNYITLMVVFKKMHPSLKYDPQKTKCIYCPRQQSTELHVWEVANAGYHLLPRYDLCYVLIHIFECIPFCTTWVLASCPLNRWFRLRTRSFFSWQGISIRGFHYVWFGWCLDNLDWALRQIDMYAFLYHDCITHIELDD